MAYQLKIKYGVDKYGVAFISEDEAVRFSRDMLYDKIITVTSRFNVRELKIKYLDDEKNFVTLPSDDLALSELFRCALQVDNADFKRITLVVEESFSPVPASLLEDRLVGRKRTSDQKTAISPSSGPSSIKKEHNIPIVSRKSLDFHNSVAGPSGVAGRPSTPLFTSPLERFLQSQREKLSCLEEKEKQISSYIANYPTANATQSSAKPKGSPTCSNCHRQEGHNRLNCPYDKCETVFHCGLMNKHPEEKSNLKEYEKQRQDVLREISKVKVDIDIKEKSAKSIQERYVNKVILSDT